MSENITLTEKLLLNGWTHKRHNDFGEHAVYCGSKVIFRGRVHEVWAWLKTLALN